MSLSIRRAQVADLDVLAPLFDAYRQFYGEPAQPAACRDFLKARLSRGESVAFLAETAARHAIGFTQLYPSFSSVRLRPLWILNDLFVAHSARGQGAGVALLDAARGHAIATGAAALLLETAAENTYAQGVYERYGYTRLDPQSRYYALALDG